MANPLLGFLGGGGSGGGGLKIFMKIVGAIARGESPTEFAMRLAQTEPALQGMDLSDLNAAADTLCRERGIDKQKLTAEIKQSVAKAKK